MTGQQLVVDELEHAERLIEEQAYRIEALEAEVARLRRPPTTGVVAV